MSDHSTNPHKDKFFSKEREERLDDDFFEANHIYQESLDNPFQLEENTDIVPNFEDYEERVTFWETLSTYKKYGILEFNYCLLVIAYWVGAFYLDYSQHIWLHLVFFGTMFYFGVWLYRDYVINRYEQSFYRDFFHNFLVIALILSALLAALMFFEGNAY